MRRRRAWRFYFGFPPSGFYFHGLRPPPSKADYLTMLREYKEDLEEELKEVKREIEEVGGGS